MNLNNENPAMNYAQQNALKFIFSHPGYNTEMITNALAGVDNPSARYEVANAVEYLVWQTPYVIRSNETQAIYITDSGNAALETV